MRISRERARLAAIDLTKAASDRVDALEKEHKTLARKIYHATLPKEVHAFAEKYPQHTSFCNYVHLDGHGFNKATIRFDDNDHVISNVEGYSQAKLELTAKTADQLKKARDKWQDAQKDYKALREETRIALLNLRTTKKIAEELPVAAPFLKGCDTIAKYPVPAVNLSGLKTKLAKLQPKP